jgi:putative ABC transport system permease protein
MIYNNFILALRRISLFKVQSIINIFGLALGLLVVLVITFIVKDELETDRFNVNYNNIYGLKISENTGLSTPAILATDIRGKISDIDAIVRMNFFFGRFAILRNGNNQPVRSNIAFVDSEFVRVFTLKPLYGSLKSALNQPYSLILTRSESRRIFGDENSVGKLLKFMDKYFFTITAIIEDPPKNSILKYTGLASLESLNAIHTYTLSCGWNCWNVNTFLLLKPNRNPVKVAEMIKRELEPAFKAANIKEVRLGSLKDIYFGNATNIDFSQASGTFSDPDYRQGSMRNVRILILVGILILAIALINYINLATSKASIRAKEIGLRKVIGASRLRLIVQLIGESTLLSFLALNIGIILYNLFFPWLNNFLDLNIPPFYMNQLNQWLIFMGATLFFGLIAGIYPAIYLTSYTPGEFLKKELHTGKRGIFIRKSLIVGQFFISLVLIMATSVIYLQSRFILKKDLGFNKENIITAGFPFGFPFDGKLFKQKLSEIPGVKDVYYSLSYPGSTIDSWMADLYYNGEHKHVQYFAEVAEPGYLEMMGFKLKEGRFFSKDLATDRGCVIINETAAKNFGLKNPMQARLPGFKDSAGYVIGVVKDFYFQSLHKKIEPMVFYNYSEGFGTANIKLVSANTDEMMRTIKSVEKAWQSVCNVVPFDFQFLDQFLNNQYRDEQKYKRIFSLFSMIAIFVACLGLFGLATFTIDQRTKEIGIRKVNGAGTLMIMGILSSEYFRLILIAFLLAAPLAWFSMLKWLNSFAYYITLPWWIFPAAGLFVTLIAIFTVAYQSWRVARLNPVDSLRYE